MTKLEMTTDDRNRVYLAERIRQLSAEIEDCRRAVQEGQGAAVLPVFGGTVEDWLEKLQADLLEAETDLEFLRAKQGAMQ